MKEIPTISLQDRFDSPNGGISMCLSRFSDWLVAHGLDEFYRVVSEESNRSPEMALPNDWHYLRRGVDGLGSSGLESTILSLKETFGRIGKLNEEYRHCEEFLEKAKEQWQVVADRARQQLAVWEPWAVAAESTWRRRSFPWNCTSGLDQFLQLRVSMEILGASAEIESPERLQRNLTFFETQIKGIQATISIAYVDEELPEDSSVVDFDHAIVDLMMHQTEVNKLASRKTEIAEEWKCARNAYWTQKRPLNVLLMQLPDTAQWALFRIFRTELREPSGI
jgi:hypothetical protein